MVNEIGVVSPGAGGFVTVQPAGGDPVTIDGWVEMPGRGLPAERFGHGVWDVTTEYGGGTTTTVGHGSVAHPGCAEGARRGAPAVRARRPGARWSARRWRSPGTGSR